MNTINYEVRDDRGYVAGWFALGADAETFRLAQARPEYYSLVVVNKTVTEDN